MRHYSPWFVFPFWRINREGRIFTNSTLPVIFYLTPNLLLLSPIFQQKECPALYNSGTVLLANYTLDLTQYSQWKIKAKGWNLRWTKAKNYQSKVPVYDLRSKFKNSRTLISFEEFFFKWSLQLKCDNELLLLAKTSILNCNLSTENCVKIWDIKEYIITYILSVSHHSAFYI